ncbi:hypothetical protein [Providencia vermicola]|uniref:hypothetical protein n=1 Tax=Providencia vermicola TaxID=333965 RepID=UPI0034DD12FE
MKSFILLTLCTTLILPTVNVQAAPQPHHPEVKAAASPMKIHKNKKPIPPLRKKKEHKKIKNKGRAKTVDFRFHMNGCTYVCQVTIMAD